MGRVMRAQGSAQVSVVRAVHAQPGITRAALSRELAMPSGFTAETVAHLVDADLVIERPAPPTGGRGRPTLSVHPHPEGPLVVVAAIAQETWQVATLSLGAQVVETHVAAHGRDRDAVLAAVSRRVKTAVRRHGGRVRAVAVVVPGIVTGTRLAQAPNLGWHDVDLSVLWPGVGMPLVAGNDATFAALAEARRGAAVGAGTALHLYMTAGIGGAVVEGGRVVLGATGTAGEFGHMPFGDPARRCPCGAYGCWNTTLDGPAVARLLRRRRPTDDVTFIRGVVERARRGSGPERSATGAVAESLGRGVAGLVNAFDPHVVTFGGLGPDVLAAAGGQLGAAYRRGIMRYRTLPPPPLVPGRFGEDGPVLGAAEAAFDDVLTDAGLHGWNTRVRA
jgi:predicted NBD/HSP70 family sugar kinase